ncbi:alkaline shock response membrane anchor protein AmaP [Actinomadura sp. 21ATH]|uniref:alkaline shock response membrane anchor protein AmaP n=1 Tax=Actinomadura sp. 21ATH TaxID=1735444 RepID=UPI0035C073E9
MDRHASRLNHVGLTLLGLVLLAAGAAGLARGLGAFGTRAAADPLITERMRSFAGDQGWFWPAVAATGVVLALLGLAWLLAQARSERLPGLALNPGGAGGSTRLSGKAVTAALEDEIGDYPGVQGVRARLLGSSARPRLRLHVAYRRGTDLAELRDRIDREGVTRLRAALERDTMPAAVRLRPAAGKKAKRRVA